MGSNLVGVEARIWGLHDNGFCVARISGLVGKAEAYVRNVITGVWLEDKLEAKRAKNS